MSNPSHILIQPSRPTIATTSSQHLAGGADHRRLAEGQHEHGTAGAGAAPLAPGASASGASASQQGYMAQGSLTSSERPFDVLPIFSRHAHAPYARHLRGTVRIRVQRATFFVHREVLMLASDVFAAMLAGGWRETATPAQRRRREAAPTPPPQPDGNQQQQQSAKSEVQEGEEHGKLSETTEGKEASTAVGDALTSLNLAEDAEAATPESGATTPSAMEASTSSMPLPVPESPSQSMLTDIAPSSLASYDDTWHSEDGGEDDEDVRDVQDGYPPICARIYLREEKAPAFQGLLCHIYPRGNCVVSWENANDLYVPRVSSHCNRVLMSPSLHLSSKFDIPSLHTSCLSFLLPSCAGKPILGLKIAEEHALPELYKEASRFLLDNYAGWSADELALLSEVTLLKLERKRSWYLERLLKVRPQPRSPEPKRPAHISRAQLGVVNIARDYVCTPSCPDPTTCARLLDEKWRSAWQSVFRFGGSPQPSIVYRALRSLEPSLSSPALQLTHTACQSQARLFVADLFDRMFSISITPAKPWVALGLSTAGSSSSHGAYSRTFGHQALPGGGAVKSAA